MFPQEGNFDIDAGDGGTGWGTIQDPPNPPKSQQISTNHNKTLKHLFVPYLSHWKGTLTLTPGMGRGDHLGPKSQKITRTKIVHTSRTFSKNRKKYL